MRNRSQSCQIRMVFLLAWESLRRTKSNFFAQSEEAWGEKRGKWVFFCVPLFSFFPPSPTVQFVGYLQLGWMGRYKGNFELMRVVRGQESKRGGNKSEIQQSNAFNVVVPQIVPSPPPHLSPMMEAPSNHLLPLLFFVPWVACALNWGKGRWKDGGPKSHLFRIAQLMQRIE